jgi:hypothetical protein
MSDEAKQNTEVSDALALVDFGTARTKEWMDVAEPMCAHCAGTENVDQAAGRILAAEVRRLRDFIRWALGENGEFEPSPEGKGAYWWRTELRQRTGLSGAQNNRDFQIEQLTRALHIALNQIDGNDARKASARQIVKHALEEHGASGDLWSLPEQFQNITALNQPETH